MRVGRANVLAALLPAMLLSGCGLMQRAGRSYDAGTDYRGLDDKSVAVVVFATEANMDEFTGARQEISDFVATQLRLHLPTIRLLNYKDVINWQDDTRNWYGLQAKDIGKHFSVDRVLYIELITYEARSDKSYGDMQGHIRANCKVYEVDAPGNEPAWSAVIDSKWPPDRPASANQANEVSVRSRVLQTFANELVSHFYDRGKNDLPVQER